MNISIIGSGSFGTALSIVLNDNGHDVLIYGRNESVIHEINTTHTNEHYLKSITLNSNIKATTDLDKALNNSEILLLSVPSKALRSVCESIDQFATKNNKQFKIIHVIKGIEKETLMTMSKVIQDTMQHQNIQGITVLSGPSHAEEVALRKPTTVTVASKNKDEAEFFQDLFINQNFRVYTNDDVIGVELGGSLKNIIALAAGILDGYDMGDNAKAALITRGLAEISRLGKSLGANPLTFLGLSGVGDLIVTCTSTHSRNWRFGYGLSKGKTKDEVLGELGMAVEGLNTIEAAYKLSQTHQIDMPITSTLYKFIFEQLDKETCFDLLMNRKRTTEE